MQKGSENIYKKCLEAMNFPVLICDADNRIVFMNRAYAEYLHVQIEEIQGLDVREVIENSRVPYVQKSHKPEYNYRHKYSSGYTKGKEIIVSRIPVIENGKYIATFGMLGFTDIESLVELAEKNQKINEELAMLKTNLLDIQNAKYSIDNILGDSEAIKHLKQEIVHVAPLKQTVLIVGESGSGKELIAHSIHNCSDRHDNMFVRVNCAAIPEHLFESEFFGYVPGSFTGASKHGKIGLFELANEGTLFLDEISELPFYMQSKLLRVLQEKEFTRLGDTKLISVDVWIIAATNRNLKDMVEQGKFRQDLYYRLNVITVYVPPLRARIDDLPLLTENFIHDLNQENGSAKTIASDTIKLLKSYSWPGNVRELSSVVSRAYYRTYGDEIMPDALLQSFTLESFKENTGNGIESLNSIVEKYEELIIKQTLKKNNGNISETARKLKVSRPKLYSIIKRINKENSGM